MIDSLLEGLYSLANLPTHMVLGYQGRLSEDLACLMTPPFEHPFNAEAIAAALAHAAATQGDAASVAALAVSLPKLRITGEGNWINDRLGWTQLLSLYLEVPPDAFGRLYQVREDVQRRIGDMFRPIIDAHRMYEGSDVFIVPADETPSDWRKQALAWLRGEGITNQGRVRSDNIAARQCDGLHFRSDEEINLYKALKAAGVSFAPLPVFVRGGKDYRRIEPDFVLIIGGMVAVIEVDGDTVHQESPVEAHARTTMLVHEGAHVERVRASDCSTLEGAEVCAKRILASLAKVRASR
jgi:hypothetical protein